MIVWTYEKQQKLDEMYKAGKSVELIALYFHLSPYTILKLLQILPAQNYESFNTELTLFDPAPYRARDYWQTYGQLLDEELNELEGLWEEMRF